MARPHRAVRGSLPTVAFTVFIAACAPREEPAAAPDSAAAARPAVAAPAIQIPPPLGRTELLQAIDQAASDHASGQASAGLTALADRRFAVKLAFGCAGAAQDTKLRYLLDVKAGALRLSASPHDFGDWKATLGAPEEIEAAEGFWLRRPWMRTPGCPAGRPLAPSAVPPTPETAALVQVFEAGGSRLLRRGDRPYTATRSAKEVEGDLSRGFRLVLEGRLADAEGGPVRCRSEGPDQRPVCLVRVRFERVAFETPDGEQLAEWRS